jgi:hypothetical protein
MSSGNESQELPAINCECEDDDEFSGMAVSADNDDDDTVLQEGLRGELSPGMRVVLGI